MLSKSMLRDAAWILQLPRISKPIFIPPLPHMDTEKFLLLVRHLFFSSLLREFTVRPLPRISQADEFVVAASQDKFERLPVFPVFISVFIKETMDNFTISVVPAVGTGLQSPVPKATEFYLTSGFIDVSFSGPVSQFAAAAWTSAGCGTAGFTVRAATSDFSY
jgi:hypothetical protein